MADLELLERLEDHYDLREAREALAEVEREGTMPLAEVLVRLGA